jgi:hypothetical protein
LYHSGVDDSARERLRTWIAASRAHALDHERVDALARSLATGDDHATAGRWGALIGYDPTHGRRQRLVQFDRRGNLVAAFRWREDGALDRAKCLTAHGTWMGVEPGASSHAAWGASDRIWTLRSGEPWAPVDGVTVFQSVEWATPDFIPPLAEPSRLPPGAGTAILNLLAAVMKDRGVARVRYRGPYPTEQLFTSLLECFRYDPTAADPLERFLDGAPLDWLPAPFESHHLGPDLCVQLRQEIDKVTLAGAMFYRARWQEIERREPRLVRDDAGRVVCSLWALGRPLADCLVLARSGEVQERRRSIADRGPAAPLAPVWRGALGDLVARESALALAGEIRAVMGAWTLEWGAIAGDLLRAEEGKIRISQLLRDAGVEWLRESPPGAQRATRAVHFALEVARLIAPPVRAAAQARLAARSEDAQRRALQGSDEEPPLSDSVGRLLTLLISGSA